VPYDDPDAYKLLMEKADVWSFALTCLEVIQNLHFSLSISYPERFPQGLDIDARETHRVTPEIKSQRSSLAGCFRDHDTLLES